MSIAGDLQCRIADGHLRLDSESAFDLNLGIGDVRDCIEWAKYLAVRVMDMDKELIAEADNFREFAKWLKYGMWLLVNMFPVLNVSWVRDIPCHAA